jgi:hypothetical protein
MSEKHLLIKTKDNRKFLTHEKNLAALVEYAKTFGAEIEMVKVTKSTKILELKALTVALCDPNYKSNHEYTIIETIYPKNKRDRQSILEEAKLIKTFIRNTLISGKQISLKDLKENFQKYELTDACLCNHLANVRKTMTKEGFTFKKISAGNYCIEQDLANAK